MNRTYKKIVLAAIVLALAYKPALSQRYLSDLDSNLLYLKDSVRPFLKRFDNLRFSGYIQPQFQVAQSPGVDSYNGPDFAQHSNNRFMLRRARIKLDYLLPTEDNYPQALFSFQIDATERGVNVRDMFLRLYETKFHNFSFTTGLFARPFGYEVNLSSAYRETPERGRMSQILMPSERDLGFMISYESFVRSARKHHLKIDAGIFNGQGLSGTTDFDGFKDFISRISVKPYRVGSLDLSGGLSLLYGGWRISSRYVYEMQESGNGDKFFVVDSAETNIGSKAPRHYYGADGQIALRHGWGTTEIRGEYWFGKQPGTQETVNNPGTLPLVNGIPVPTYNRNFDGAFLYFLQNIFSKKHQLMVKYDWFDPNTDVANSEVDNNFSQADLKFHTLGFGYAFYPNDYLKLLLYYDIVKNDPSQLNGFTSDLKDNIFTCRLQFRF